MSEKDREVICNIISEMLDNPDQTGIYPTSAAFLRLEHYIEGARSEALGYMHAKCCILLDNGKDPREESVSELYAEAIINLR